MAMMQSPSLRQDGKPSTRKFLPASVSAEVRAGHELSGIGVKPVQMVVKATEDFHRRREEEKKEDAARCCIGCCFFTKSFAQDSAFTKTEDLKQARLVSKTALVCRDQKSGALFK